MFKDTSLENATATKIPNNQKVHIIWDSKFVEFRKVDQRI